MDYIIDFYDQNLVFCTDFFCALYNVESPSIQLYVVLCTYSSYIQSTFTMLYHPTAILSPGPIAQLDDLQLPNTETIGLDQHRPIDRIIIALAMLVKKIEYGNANIRGQSP